MEPQYDVNPFQRLTVSIPTGLVVTYYPDTFLGEFEPLMILTPHPHGLIEASNPRNRTKRIDWWSNSTMPVNRKAFILVNMHAYERTRRDRVRSIVKDT